MPKTWIFNFRAMKLWIWLLATFVCLAIVPRLKESQHQDAIRWILLTPLILLVALSIRVKSVRSPGGGSSARSFEMAFGFALLLIAILLRFTALRDFDGNSDHSHFDVFILITFLLSAAAIFPIQFLPIHKFHILTIRQAGKLRRWRFRLSSFDTFRTEYLWTPDGQALLVAHSEEHFWLLYRYDLADARPVKRMVSFNQDYHWLEPLWRTCDFIPGDALQDDPSDYEQAQDYHAQCRNFFRFLLSRAAGFPLYEMRQLRYINHRAYRSDAYRRVLDCIPSASTAFANIRNEAEAKLARLAGKPCKR